MAESDGVALALSLSMYYLTILYHGAKHLPLCWFERSYPADVGLALEYLKPCEPSPMHVHRHRHHRPNVHQLPLNCHSLSRSPTQAVSDLLRLDFVSQDRSRKTSCRSRPSNSNEMCRGPLAKRKVAGLRRKHVFRRRKCTGLCR